MNSFRIHVTAPQAKVDRLAEVLAKCLGRTTHFPGSQAQWLAVLEYLNKPRRDFKKMPHNEARRMNLRLQQLGYVVTCKAEDKDFVAVPVGAFVPRIEFSTRWISLTIVGKIKRKRDGYSLEFLFFPSDGIEEVSAVLFGLSQYLEELRVQFAIFAARYAGGRFVPKRVKKPTAKKQSKKK